MLTVIFSKKIQGVKSEAISEFIPVFLEHVKNIHIPGHIEGSIGIEDDSGKIIEEHEVNLGYSKIIGKDGIRRFYVYNYEVESLENLRDFEVVEVYKWK